MLLTIQEARDWLRIDGVENDGIITPLINAASEYITLSTGLTEEQQTASPTAKTAAKFLLSLWYDPGQSDAEKLQRSIDTLLKTITAINT